MDSSSDMHSPPHTPTQVSCLNDVCGMFPFIAVEQPDQFYRLFTSLCLHAGVLHLLISVVMQHLFLADLERLIGPVRSAIVYIGAGVAGNLTSAILEPYRPEVGPLGALVGVLAALAVQLAHVHWYQLRRPNRALAKIFAWFAALCALGECAWQQNWVALVVAGMVGGTLTVALVPFVAFRRSGRHTRVNFIWACVLVQSLVFAGLFVVFYVFPAAFVSFDWTSTTTSTAAAAAGGGGGGGVDVGGGIVVGGSRSQQLATSAAAVAANRVATAAAAAAAAFGRGGADAPDGRDGAAAGGIDDALAAAAAATSVTEMLTAAAVGQTA